MSASVTLHLKELSLPKDKPDKNFGNGIVKVIEINEGTPSVSLGRSEATGIQDKRCSRDHISVTLDHESNELVIQQNGANPGCVQLNGNEEILAKCAVKRVPLKSKAKQLAPLCIYMIHKDHLYGYDVHIKQAPDKQHNKELAPQVTETVELKGKNKRKADSTLDNFFQVKKSKADSATPAQGTWTEIESKVFFYTMPGVKGSEKLAAFDMDGTIITTKSGAKWPKDKHDWKFLYPHVPDKLRQLHKDGHAIAIFTNQGSIASGTLKPEVIQHKIENIISEVNIPIQAIIAGSKKGLHRKPMTGMWDYIAKEVNDGVTVDLTQSVYVGDAAGRVKDWQKGKKKDFACSDRLFALNVGVKFATPESFFEGHKEGQFEMPEFDPVDAMKVKDLLDPKSSMLISPKQELVVMVGFPGSGKSYIATHQLAGYKYINRDTLGSWQKCVARCEEHLKNGDSVVIDNTNPDEESRSRYILPARKLNVPVRCFLMTTSYKQARHNEKFRQLTDPNHKSIPDMVVHSYKNKYKEPELKEGFQEIVRVNFVPSFESEDMKKLYTMHLLEK